MVDGSDAASHDFCDRPDLFDHFGKFLGLERLFAIGEGVSRIRVDFNDQPVGACSHSSPCHSSDVIGIACGMTWVENHRQVGKAFQNRYGVDVGSVARGSLEGADAALDKASPDDCRLPGYIQPTSTILRWWQRDRV